jgi:hypothetical protein
VALVKRLESTGSFAEFTRVRRNFEDFLLKHKYLSNQITQKYGSGLKGYAKVVQLYELLLAHLQGGVFLNDDLEKAIMSERDLSFLRFSEEEDDQMTRKSFTTDVKSSTFLTEAVASLLHCKICGGYMHCNSITMDHVKDKKDGGTGDPANAQLAHPYCNFTYKDLQVKAVHSVSG